MDPLEAQKFQKAFFRDLLGVPGILAVAESVPGVSFFVKDVESRYIRANAATLATYDLRDERELVGRRAREFFPDLLAEAYEGEDRRVMESAEPVLGEIWLVPHVRGTPRWFSSSKAPLLRPDGSVAGLMGLMTPIATPEDQRTHFQELRRVIEYLETRFVEDVTVESLAKIAGISVPHLNRRFRQLLRLSPKEYILSLRVQEAQRQLVTSNAAIGEVALATGFYDQSHFTKTFRKATGMTPLKYRRNYRKV